ncbi:putative RNA polymerase II subunit B1 CTD phosphatase RPAP2 [Xenopus laevis]|uniref:RNA polymerase II subunit B1 CTD phosphatase RPAP2 homolog n=2 Tax=Xenopus laevis TaxID=8355 RepID=A0A974D6U9_XENLA|nr:putative RNA polymerase II subunit B1 CTD phosphatase RPAP2 [Xenopus laevis]OCT85170.1 hypothetical protein XELAEV_18023334mg [Xenopus laevis]
MAERGSTSKSRKARGKSSGNFQVSDLTSEDAAKRRAALEIAVKRKIEAEKLALQIVEHLLEDDVSEEYLLDCAKCIAPAHYKDAIEERTIIQLCGYPLCNKRLENVPKQKYKISTKTNKVYDITERKCFCSNFCFRASKYYEAQLPKTPVWTRDVESPPEIKLLKEGKSGQSGIEVKLSVRRIKSSEIEKPATFTEECDPNSPDSDSDGHDDNKQTFVSSVISNCDDTEKVGQRNSINNNLEKAPNLEHSLSETMERLQKCSVSDQEVKSNSHHQVKKTQNCPNNIETADHVQSNVEILGLTQRAVSKKGAEQLRKILRNSTQYQTALKEGISPVAAKGSMLEVLTQTLNEWKTEETLKFLYGEQYVFETSFNKERCVKSEFEIEDLDEDDLSVDPNNVSSLDESLPFRDISDPAKPVPDYEKLKEEVDMQHIKVKEFFKGHYVFPEEVKSIIKEARNNKSDISWTPALPLVDSCSQQQIRRRIVLEKLKKVLPAILLPLQITYSEVAKELHDLVRTLRFTNKNITHTIPEWSIIAIVLLSVLLPSIPLHKDTQTNPLNTQFVSKLLEELHFQNEDLERLKERFACNHMPNVS